MHYLLMTTATSCSPPEGNHKTTGIEPFEEAFRRAFVDIVDHSLLYEYFNLPVRALVARKIRELSKLLLNKCYYWDLVGTSSVS